MAIYRSNQSAFIRGDINRLKVGAILEVPSSAELFALDPALAEREFSMALEGRRVTAHPLAKEAVAEHPSSDHLAIAQSPPAGAAGVVSQSVPAAGNNPNNPSASKLGSLKNALLLVRESSESNRQETEDLRGRIRDLEGQLADIRKLLKVRNQQLAELQGSQQEEPELKVAEETGVLPARVADKQPPEPNPIPEAEAKIRAGIDEAVKADSKTTHPLQAAAIDASKTMHTRGAASEPKKPEASPEPAGSPHNPMEPPDAATKPQTTTTTKASNDAETLPTGPKLAQVSPPAVTAKATAPIRKPADLQQAVAHRESEIAQFWESMPMPAMAVAIGVPLLLLPIGWWMVHRRRLVEEAIETNQFNTVAIPIQRPPPLTTSRNLLTNVITTMRQPRRGPPSGISVGWIGSRERRMLPLRRTSISPMGVTGRRSICWRRSFPEPPSGWISSSSWPRHTSVRRTWPD
jgi:pilus assembly protein FimV